MNITSPKTTTLPVILHAHSFDAATSLKLGFQKNLKERYLNFLGLSEYACRLPARMLSGITREVDPFVYKYIQNKLKEGPLSAFEFAGGTSLTLPNTTRNWGSFFLSRILVKNFGSQGLALQASDLESEQICLSTAGAQVLAVADGTRSVMQLELKWEVLELIKKLASQYGLGEQLLNGQLIDLADLPRKERRIPWKGVLACIQLRPWVDRDLEQEIFALDVKGGVNAMEKLPSSYDVVFCRHTLESKTFEVKRVCESAQHALKDGGRAFLNFDCNEGLIVLELSKTRILRRYNFGKASY